MLIWVAFLNCFQFLQYINQTPLSYVTFTKIVEIFILDLKVVYIHEAVSFLHHMVLHSLRTLELTST